MYIYFCCVSLYQKIVLYSCADALHNLELLRNTILKWLNENSMKAYPGKYHLLVSCSYSSKIKIHKSSNFL